MQFKETLQEDAVIWIYSQGHEHLPGSVLKDSPVTLTTGQTASLVSRHKLHSQHRETEAGGSEGRAVYSYTANPGQPRLPETTFQKNQIRK